MARPGGQGLGLSVLVDQKSPKWPVPLPGESLGWPHGGGGGGGVEGGSWDGAQTHRAEAEMGEQMLSRDSVRGARPGCKGTEAHVWNAARPRGQMECPQGPA